MVAFVGSVVLNELRSLGNLERVMRKNLKLKKGAEKAREHTLPQGLCLLSFARSYGNGKITICFYEFFFLGASEYSRFSRFTLTINRNLYLQPLLIIKGTILPFYQ